MKPSPVMMRPFSRTSSSMVLASRVTSSTLPGWPYWSGIGAARLDHDVPLRSEITHQSEAGSATVGVMYTRSLVPGLTVLQS